MLEGIAGGFQAMRLSNALHTAGFLGKASAEGLLVLDPVRLEVLPAGTAKRKMLDRDLNA
jgi:hypothetical protein